MIVFLLAVDVEIRKKVNRLIKDIAKNKMSALDELYDCVGKKMFYVAYNVSKHKQMAEDIVSDSFLRIVRYADKFDTSTNGYAWIMKIVQNNAYNFIKSEGYRMGENIDDFYSLSSSFNEIASTETTILLEGAMAGLDPIERKIIYNKYYLDLTIRQIAEKLQLSKSDAGRKVKSAEKKIKDYLVEHDYHD